MKNLLYCIGLFVLCCIKSFSQTLDTSFGVNGLVKTIIYTGPTPDCSAGTSLKLTNGKLVYEGIYHWEEVFYSSNVNGVLDSTFGVNGKFTTPSRFSAFLPSSQKMIEQSSNKIIIGVVTSNHNVGFFRFNANGTTDTSFGDNGFVETFTGFGNNTHIDGYGVQPDGKLLFARIQNDVLSIKSYTINGLPNTAFGVNGVYQQPNTLFKNINSFTVLPNRKILISGNTELYDQPSTINKIYTAQYNSNGSLDTTFGTNGITYSDSSFGDNVFFGDVALQPDGKILLMGVKNHVNYGRGGMPSGLPTGFFLYRLFANGGIDTTYGINGMMPINYQYPSNCYTKLTLDPYGNSIVMAAYDNIDNYNLHLNFSLVRYSSAGVLETSFGTNGWLISNFADAGSTIRYSSASGLFFEGNLATIHGSINDDTTDYLVMKRYAIQDLATLNNEAAKGIKIYPNPSTGIYTVDTNDSSDVYETIIVYDVLGKQVHQEKVLAKTTMLNIEKLDSGYYFAKLQGTTSSLVIKIIKK